MNGNLQNILELIGQSEPLTEAQKDAIVKAIKDADKELTVTAFKLERTEKVKHTTSILLEETIEELEQKRKAVEAQNRELEIEAALERVRTVAMSMNKTDDVLSICKVMFTELKLLGFDELRNALINFFDDERNTLLDYDYADFSGGHIAHIPYNSHPAFENFLKRIRSATDAFAELVVGEDELESWKERRRQSGEYEDPRLENITALYYYFYSIGVGAVGISTFSSLTEEKLQLIKRFRNVFDLAYRRYIDIQKAEAQAREAQIELALERVRARTMAMQHSDELMEAANLLFQQLQSLGIPVWSCGYNIWEKGEQFCTGWMSTRGAIQPSFRIPLSGNPTFVHMKESRLKGETFYVEEVKGEALAEHYRNMFSLPDFKAIADEQLKDGFTLPASQTNHVFNFKHGNLIFIASEPVPEAWDIFKRFTIVFEQTYTRFLDLQKAEAQAREAQIELGLERVRARAMAMHQSGELAELIEMLFKELTKLGFSLDRCIVMIMDEVTNDSTWWVSPASTGLFVKYKKFKPFEEYLKEWRARTTRWSYILGGEEKKEWGNYIFYNTELSLLPEPVKTGMHSLENVCLNVSFSSFGSLTFSTLEPLPEKEFDILMRFANVFNQTYTRFLDLQKAEAQARESEIELALERVRARTMAMQRSEELPEVAALLFQQVKTLGVPQFHCGFNIFEIDDKECTWYPGSADGDIQPPCKIPLTEHPVFIAFNESRKRGDELFVYEKEGEYQAGHYRYMLSLPVLGEILQNMLDAGIPFPTFQIDHLANFSHGNLLFITSEHFPEMHDTFKRFAKVFDQTYTRFLDLQKAEAQAREAQIELALERVRARTMAMHKSDEVKEVAHTLYTELQKLDFTYGASTIIIMDKNTGDMESWVGGFEQGKYPESYFVKYFENPCYKAQLNAWKEGKKFLVYELMGKDKEQYDENLFTKTDFQYFPKKEKEWMRQPNAVTFSLAYMKHGAIHWGPSELTQEQFKILQRFATVFEQTYTRFLDLQKAEAQAREAQIEAVLERVRAKTMAMQRSNELLDVASILFQQVKALGVPQWNCGFNIWNIGDKEFTYYPGSPDGIISPSPCKISLMEHPIFKRFDESRKRGAELLVYEIEGEEQADHYRYMLSLPGVGDLLQSMLDAGFELPTFQIDHLANFSYGNLIFITYKHFPEMHDVFKRFAKVFEQTYTRFLDLQKAEAQSREAQIELSLERVRAKTMAMHNSADVGETAAVMVDELKKLGIETIRCGIGIMHEPGDMEVWTISTDENNKTDIVIGWLDMNIHPLLHGAFESWRRKNESYSYELKDDDLLNYYNAINNYPGYPIRYDTSNLPLHIHHNEFYFPEGILFAFSLEQLLQEQRKIFKRFAGVFGQTYRRYLDLKKAEAQVKEARIEAALEKVRSRTMAMQRSDELAETAAVFFKQLIALGIEPNRLYIAIVKDAQGNSEFWITEEDGTKVSTAFSADLNKNESFSKMFDGWKQQKKSLVLDMQGEELQNYFRHLTSLGVSFKGGLQQKRRVQDIAYFSKGFIGMASPEEQPAETLLLLERFAAVFNLTFTRFNDLKIAEAHARQAEQDLIAIKEARHKAEDALTELQTTQKQLIQSEKMASLGELTAGIAHEIQNPLNFVNNFAEVSNELIDEMNQEIDLGNNEEVKAIANDIKQNLEKINHHGKRAEAIVKGMLQHSRTSTGQKESTDINVLADEYLRLAYHGLRAKDKTFNATMHTSFDDSIEKINIIPQDIGRVILNLINNAFYAVSERKKITPEGYEPTVSISTINKGEHIEIHVKDNGRGIPQKIVDKIFQPFFTTKPAGQGTGLGLSLSYDIIKAHGGEIKVETKEGEGSEFAIIMPV